MRRLLSLFLCVLLCFSIPFGSGVVASATGPTEGDSGNNQNPGFVIKIGTSMNGITSTNRGTVYSGVTMQAFTTDLTGIRGESIGFMLDSSMILMNLFPLVLLWGLLIKSPMVLLLRDISPIC